MEGAVKGCLGMRRGCRGGGRGGDWGCRRVCGGWEEVAEGVCVSGYWVAERVVGVARGLWCWREM